jgi:hypothetical protein
MLLHPPMFQMNLMFPKNLKNLKSLMFRYFQMNPLGRINSNMLLESQDFDLS